MKKRNIIISLLLIIIISTLFILKTSYYMGHDLDFHLSRIISIKDCLNLKQICYIAPKYMNGYGYGTPVFYPEIFLIIPALLLYWGLSLTNSYKIFLFLINIFSILSMYYSTKKIFKDKKSAIFSSFIYGFASYRIIDITTRAALGEILSFIFIPLVILGIYKIIYDDYKQYYFLIVGMSGLILCHLISSIIIFIYLIIICLINIKQLFKDKKRILYLFLSTIITILLTSYFTFPMLEMLFSNTYKLSMPSTILIERAMPIHYLFIEYPIIFAISNRIWDPGSIGYMYLLIIALYFIKRNKKEDNFIKQNLIISIIFILLTTKIFPWNLFQNTFKIIQFPWRLYIIPTTLISIIAYNIIKKFKDYKTMIIIITIIIGIFSIHSITIFKNTHYIDKDKYNDYEIMWGEYLPIKYSYNYIKNRDDIVTNNNEIKYTYEKKDNILTIKFDNNNKFTKLELPFIYYKGYVAYLNNKKINTYETNNGLVGINITKNNNQGNIKVYYEGTIIQKISKYISIITLLISVLYLIIIKKKK